MHTLFYRATEDRWRSSLQDPLNVMIKKKGHLCCSCAARDLELIRNKKVRHESSTRGNIHHNTVSKTLKWIKKINKILHQLHSCPNKQARQNTGDVQEEWAPKEMVISDKVIKAEEDIRKWLGEWLSWGRHVIATVSLRSQEVAAETACTESASLSYQ